MCRYVGPLKARVRYINTTQRKTKQNMVIQLSIWLRKSSSLSVFNNLGNERVQKKGFAFSACSPTASYNIPLLLQCNSWSHVLPGHPGVGVCCNLKSAKSDQEDMSGNSSVFSRAWYLSLPTWNSWILETTSTHAFLG